jgi:predicted  nucleic acid-binding Zn-ribbon protein
MASKPTKQDLEDTVARLQEELTEVRSENDTLEDEILDLQADLRKHDDKDGHVDKLMESCKGLVSLVHKSQIFKQPLDSVGMARHIQDIEDSLKWCE